MFCSRAKGGWAKTTDDTAAEVQLEAGQPVAWNQAGSWRYGVSTKGFFVVWHQSTPQLVLSAQGKTWTAAQKVAVVP